MPTETISRLTAMKTGAVAAYKRLVARLQRGEQPTDEEIIQTTTAAGYSLDAPTVDLRTLEDREGAVADIATADELKVKLVELRASHAKAVDHLRSVEAEVQRMLNAAVAPIHELEGQIASADAKQIQLRNAATRTLNMTADPAIKAEIERLGAMIPPLEQKIEWLRQDVTRCKKFADKAATTERQVEAFAAMRPMGLHTDSSHDTLLPTWLGGGLGARGRVPHPSPELIDAGRREAARLRQLAAGAERAEQEIAEARQEIARLEQEIKRAQARKLDPAEFKLSS